MQTRRISMAFIGLWLAAATAQAQTPNAIMHFDHPFSIEAPYAGGFLEDSDGLFWYGTQNGVVRYDGYEQKMYRSGPNSISADYVNAITEDADGDLWFGTKGGGVDRYDKRTNTFTNYRHDPNNPNSLSHNEIPQSAHALFAAQDGTLFAATMGGGLNRIDKRTNTVTRYQHDDKNPQSIADNFPFCVMQDRQGRVWVGTMSGGLDELDLKTGAFAHHAFDANNPRSIGSNFVYKLIEDKDDPNILWIGTWGGGLNKFNKQTNAFTRYSQDNTTDPLQAKDEVLSLLDDGEGHVWVGWYRTPKGLSIFDKQSETFTTYHSNPKDPYSLNFEDTILTIAKDRAGSIWIQGIAGLNRYNPFALRFRAYSTNPFNEKSLSSNFVVPMYVDKQGRLWIGTFDAGLNRYDPATDSFIHYRHDPNDPMSIRHDFVTHMFEDSFGRFWIATRGGTLSLFDPETGKCLKHYTHDPNDPKSIPAHDSLRAIIEDRNAPGVLWTGGFISSGLIRFDTQSETFTLYQVDPTKPSSLHSSDIYGLYQDQDGIIWISTNGAGMERFDPATETFTHYPYNPNDPTGIGSNQVWDIHEFTPDTLWVPTVGGGLNLFNKKTGQWTRLNKSNGFPVNTIVTMRQDRSGNIWMGTDEGLLKYQIATGKTRLYVKGDGLQANVFVDQAAAVMPDGEMWFGGSQGVCRFYPDAVKDNPYVPPVMLTALKQSGELMNLPAAPERLQELRLDWRHNFFEFEFAALNYVLPEKNRYKYKLEGLDQDWYDAGAKRYARYAGLPDGEYLLRILGSNNDGVWNDTGASLKVVVMPPYWRTWWFYALCTLAGAGVIGFVYRTQMKIQTEAALHHAADREKEAAEREKIAAQREREAANAANTAKSEFLSNMSHELRTPLNGILGYAQILIRDKTLTAVQKDGLNIIQQSGSHLLTLINDILDLAKVEAGRLDLVPGNVHFRSFLDGIAGIIRMRAEQKNLLFELQTPTPLPDGVVADEKRLRQVLLNLLGNAVKFTKQGKVLLRVSALRSRQQEAQHVDLIRFEVIDTGVGMTPESVGKLFKPFEQVGDAQSRAEGTGLGLAISRRLVQLMGGDIEIKSELGHGTTFWFEIELPGAAVELREVQQRREQEVTGYAGARRKILIADDKLSNRLVMVHLLDPLGFEIELAEDGQQLVDKAQTFRPDAILTDLIMPNLTGFDAAQQIRQMPDVRNTVIIAVSASVFEMDKEKSKIAGCDDFLSKPVVASQLFDMLGTHLRLEWTYAEREAASESPSAAETPAAEIALPTSEELTRLRDAALGGVPDEILAEAARLEQRNPAYAPFARRIAAFVQQYQDEELLAYLEQAQVK